MKKVISLLFVVGVLMIPLIASAACPTGFEDQNGTCVAKTIPPTTATSVYNAIDTVTNILFGALLLIALVFILLAALNFILAHGDAAKVQTAQNQILYAVIGITIAILAKGIVALVQSLIKP